jgi:hypothetical protein
LWTAFEIDVEFRVVGLADGALPLKLPRHGRSQVMIRRLSLRRLLHPPKCLLPTYRPLLRWNSTKQPPSPIGPADYPPSSKGVTNESNAHAKTTERFERVLNRTPKFLRKWLQPIANRPISHVAAFLILHEVEILSALWRRTDLGNRSRLLFP